MKKLLGVLVALLGFGSAGAQAQNLVLNPGFESGMTSWTQGAAACWSAGAPAHTGANSAGTGCTGSGSITTDPSAGGAWVYQDIPTVAGQRYKVTFSYETSTAGDTPIELQVFFGTVPASLNAPGTCTGTCIFDTQTGANPYVTVTRIVTATAATSRLEFLGRNDPAGIFFDDVSVTPLANVPASSDWSLALLALLLVAAATWELRRRGRRS